MDLMYRGLALGNRVRLTEAQVSAGFLELAAPMPVGTTMTLSTDEGVSFEVTVVEVCEQATPGMVVKPVVSPAAEAWWGANVGSIAAALPVEVVLPKRRDDEDSKLVDDGRKTVAMEVAQPILDDGADAPTSSNASGRGRRRKRKR